MPEEQPSTAGRPEGGRRVQWAPKLEQVRVTLSHIPAIDGLRVLAVGWVVAGNSLYGMGTSIGPVRPPTHPPSDGLTSRLAAADDGAVSQRTGLHHALPHATQPRALASASPSVPRHLQHGPRTRRLPPSRSPSLEEPSVGARPGWGTPTGDVPGATGFASSKST